MTTAILYTFVFSTWGLGLLSWVVVLGHKLEKWGLDTQERNLEITQKKLLFNKFNSLSAPTTASASGATKQTSWGSVTATEPPSKESLPEKIKELMASSPLHPEVEEIDSGDQILGVRFEAAEYPPAFGDEDDEE
jgi:hypothetical protein